MISAYESSEPLSITEMEFYKEHLQELGLNENIWDVYQKFLQVSSKYSIPRIVRFNKGKKQLAHFYMMKCLDYGATLSGVRIIKFFVKLFGIPAYSWIRSGVGAENNANPCFYNKLEMKETEPSQLIEILRKKYFMLFILDLISRQDQYTGSLILPYTDDGMVDTREYNTANDYLKQHKNLKKKIRCYNKNGGRIEIEKGKLTHEDQEKVEACVLSTSKKSVFKLPYQDIYPAMCKSSSDIDNTNIIHFTCRSDEEFFGYHSFIQFDNQMRCLNGAFNRTLKSTFHAYENMIFKVVGYAIDNNIQQIYFGPVLNETKKRMMNRFITTRLYVYSKFPFVLKLFAPILKSSRMVNKNVLAFSGIKK